MRLGIIAALSLVALACAGCKTGAQEEQELAEKIAKIQAEAAEREAKYGKCAGDGCLSVSVIGKTTQAELVRAIRACGRFPDTSSYVSANAQHFFVRIDEDRFMWHFVNGVLVSYSR
jgi:hypothetical protein